MGRLNAGQLKERITLVTPGPSVSDGRGGYQSTGADQLTSVWARVRPLKGTELLSLGQVLNGEAYEITIRHEASAQQRVTWKGKTLNVQAVAPDEDREYQVLTCYDSGK